MRSASASLLVAGLLLVACRSTDWQPPSAAESARVRAEVGDLLENLTRDLRRDGPLAWLDHFGDEGFFMATDGVIQFRDRDEAVGFLTDFAPNVAAMDLRWLEVRIVPLSADLATVAASYDERIELVDEHVDRFAGFFTSVAVRTEHGWRLGHGHWSSPAKVLAAP